VVRDPKGKPDALFFQRAVRLRVFYAISELIIEQQRPHAVIAADIQAAREGRMEKYR